MHGRTSLAAAVGTGYVDVIAGSLNVSQTFAKTTRFQ